MISTTNIATALGSVQQIFQLCDTRFICPRSKSSLWHMYHHTLC